MLPRSSILSLPVQPRFAKDCVTFGATADTHSTCIERMSAKNATQARAEDLFAP